MRRRVPSIVLVSTLVLMAAGCTSEDTATAPPAESPAPAAPAAPPAAPPAAAPKPAPGKPGFNKPVVPEKPGARVVARASVGLIPPTNVEARVVGLQKGRKDPFGLFPVVPTAIAVKPDPNAAPGTPGATTTATGTRVGGRSTVPSFPQNRRPTTRPGGTTTATGTGVPGRLPGLPSSSPSIVVPPPLPEPDAARAVAVTGVVEVGGEVQAIVKAPDEPTSRYVRVGQRLSNGRVLVKRIELNQGGDPVVVLEQFGIEVTRAVGEQPAAATGDTAAPPS